MACRIHWQNCLSRLACPIGKRRVCNQMISEPSKKGNHIDSSVSWLEVMWLLYYDMYTLRTNPLNPTCETSSSCSVCFFVRQMPRKKNHALDASSNTFSTALWYTSAWRRCLGQYLAFFKTCFTSTRATGQKGSLCKLIWRMFNS